jgi:hypothetical protein
MHTYAFCGAVTASFRGLSIFVVMEVASRRLVPFKVTGHPTAAWRVRQVREALAAPQAYRFVLHDRDGICSR